MEGENTLSYRGRNTVLPCSDTTLMSAHMPLSMNNRNCFPDNFKYSPFLLLKTANGEMLRGQESPLDSHSNVNLNENNDKTLYLYTVP